ncbi:MAG: glycosyltransferase family 9 protein [Nanoarchaeota archaeon]
MVIKRLCLDSWENRILCLPQRGIGDLIFFLPLLHSLHSSFPASEIFIPSTSQGTPYFQLINLIGFLSKTPKFLPNVSQDEFELHRQIAFRECKGKLKREYEHKIYEKYLQGEQYDLLINSRSNRVESVLCASQVTRKDVEESYPFHRKHMVDRFLFYADYLGIPRVVSFKLDLTRQDLTDESIRGEYVIFNLGGSVKEKKWSTTGYSNVSQWCAKKGLSVILIGGEEDRDQASQIQGSNVINRVGCHNGYAIRDIVPLVRGSRVCLSGDTGILHLADALGAKVLGLYGPTSPERYGPYNQREYVISRNRIDQKLENICSCEVIGFLEQIV